VYAPTKVGDGGASLSDAAARLGWKGSRRGAVAIRRADSYTADLGADGRHGNFWAERETGMASSHAGRLNSVVSNHIPVWHQFFTVSGETVFVFVDRCGTRRINAHCRAARAAIG
jgi:hypothetical protein